jgi:predicted HAD superfamily phosphohydrolase
VKEAVLRNGPRYRCYCPSLEEVYSDIHDVQMLNVSDYALRVAISFNGQQYTAQDIDFFYYGVKKLIPR